MKDCYKKAIRNRAIISFVVVVLGCLCSYFAKLLFNFNIMDIRKIIFSNCKESVITFLEICIGIYATVISLLASQKTYFTVKLSQKQLDDKFVAVISIGMVLNIFTSLLLSIISTSYLLTFSLALILCFLSILYFADFLRLLVIMFCCNMDFVASEHEEENKYRNKILTNLEEIRRKSK